MKLSRLLIAGLTALLPLGAAYAADAAQPATKLPKVVVLSTGGTIAGESASSTDVTGYKAGQRSGESLVKAVPEIAKVADVEVYQVANVSSPNLEYSHLLELSQAANKHLSDPDVAGVVITHGTSTAEETAIFLELTVKNSKPIVVVGAMRPATAISADGPFNLLQSIALAAHPDARDRGVMIMMDDRISSGFYTSKTHTLGLDTFQATDQGHLGFMVGTRPYFFYTPARAPGVPYFDVTGLKDLPKVEILYGYVDNDPGLLEYVARSGAKGVVIAAPGNSSLSQAYVNKVTELQKAGFPVVRATRTDAGIVTPKKEDIAAGFYNPAKARLLLALALGTEPDIDQKKLQSYFLPY